MAAFNDGKKSFHASAMLLFSSDTPYIAFLATSSIKNANSCDSVCISDFNAESSSSLRVYRLKSIFL